MALYEIQINGSQRPVRADATGARLREVPFTPDRLKAALLRPVGA